TRLAQLFDEIAKQEQADVVNRVVVRLAERRLQRLDEVERVNEHVADEAEDERRLESAVRADKDKQHQSGGDERLNQHVDRGDEFQLLDVLNAIEGATQIVLRMAHPHHIVRHHSEPDQLIDDGRQLVEAGDGKFQVAGRALEAVEERS